MYLKKSVRFSPFFAFIISAFVTIFYFTSIEKRLDYLFSISFLLAIFFEGIALSVIGLIYLLKKG
jgi:hypothetical protein